LAKLDVPDAGQLPVRIGIATGLVVVEHRPPRCVEALQPELTDGAQNS
jgi:hypothetical protein